MATTTSAVSGVVAASFLLVWAMTPAAPASLSPPTEAEAAQAYLREKQPEPLSGPLQQLLADPDKPRVATEPHPLLNQPAPAFELPAVDGRPVRLADLTDKGPVVVVFYYGYSCNHCVAQLFGLQEDRGYFRELGATVVAVSPDPAARTKEQFAKYGAFDFPVLSDGKDRVTAARYGVFRPKTGESREWEAHGTFVIDRAGVVRWAKTGDEPFLGTATLLGELARLQNRTPQPQPEDRP